MSLPVPRPGLVICYAYLWAEEQRLGREEGVKNRPCAIIAARQVIDGREIVTVLPITHSPPSQKTPAIELPPVIKVHLGLDAAPSWIMLTETNDFLWPGPDLFLVPGVSPPRFHFGMLPPRFYAHVRDRVLEVSKERRQNRIWRNE